MSDFCLATALAILLDFFFEFLVFLPTLALFYEEKERTGEEEEGSCGGKWVSNYSFWNIYQIRSSWEFYTSMLLSTPGKISVAFLVLGLYTSSLIGEFVVLPHSGFI